MNPHEHATQLRQASIRADHQSQRPLDIDEIRELAYRVAGAASMPFMMDHPEYPMPVAEITAGVEAVLRDLYPAAAKKDTA